MNNQEILYSKTVQNAIDQPFLLRVLEFIPFRQILASHVPFLDRGVAFYGVLHGFAVEDFLIVHGDGLLGFPVCAGVCHPLLPDLRGLLRSSQLGLKLKFSANPGVWSGSGLENTVIPRGYYLFVPVHPLLSVWLGEFLSRVRFLPGFLYGQEVLPPQAKQGERCVPGSPNNCHGHLCWPVSPDLFAERQQPRWYTFPPP